MDEGLDHCYLGAGCIITGSTVSEGNGAVSVVDSLNQFKTIYIHNSDYDKFLYISFFESYFHSCSFLFFLVVKVETFQSFSVYPLVQNKVDRYIFIQGML